MWIARFGPSPRPRLTTRATPTRRRRHVYGAPRVSTKKSASWPAVTGRTGGCTAMPRTVRPGRPRTAPASITGGLVPQLPARSRTSAWKRYVPGTASTFGSPNLARCEPRLFWNVATLTGSPWSVRQTVNFVRYAREMPLMKTLTDFADGATTLLPGFLAHGVPTQTREVGG